MKKLIFLSAVLIMCASEVLAQDIIAFRDGKKVEAKVLEITQNEIKYKKYHNPDSPLYTIHQSRVQYIKYAYGEIEEYGDVKAEAEVEIQPSQKKSSPAPATPKHIDLPGDEENHRIIKGYNNADIHPVKNKTEKYKMSPACGKWNFTPESVVSNEQAKLSFESAGSNGRYDIKFVNKLNTPIYVDLGNSFSSCEQSNERSMCFFDPSKTTTIMDSSSSGASINVGAITSALGIGGIIGRLAGGVNVGGSGTSGVSTTYNSQRFLIVAPKGSSYISEWLWQGDTAIKKGIWLGAPYSRKIIKNSVKTYSVNNTPCKIDYYITYSTDPEFKTYSQLKFTIYVSKEVDALNKYVTNGRLLEW